jgi:hypothetical protein
MQQDTRFNRVKISPVKGKEIIVPTPGVDSSGKVLSDGELTLRSHIRSGLYKRPVSPVPSGEDDLVPAIAEPVIPDVHPESALANSPESKSFIATALTWQGSVTPRVLPRVAVVAAYAAVVYIASRFAPVFSIPVTPFEYSGAVLTLILVMRVNAGHDRWWEARKIWGSIVNQSRNLGMVV